MIGRWMQTLRDDQLWRLMTTRMAPYDPACEDENGKPPCVVRCVWPMRPEVHADRAPNVFVGGNSYRVLAGRDHEDCVPEQYDVLCERFGTSRVNLAIRERALKIWMGRQPVPAVPQVEAVTA